MGAIFLSFDFVFVLGLIAGYFLAFPLLVVILALCVIGGGYLVAIAEGNDAGLGIAIIVSAVVVLNVGMWTTYYFRPI